MSDRELYDSPTRRCPDEIRLAAFVDGGLEPRDRARVERHLIGCDHCLGQVSALVRLQDADLPEVDPELLRRARAIPPTRTRSHWIPAWGWAACGVTACLAISVTLWIRPPQPAQKDTVRTSYARGSALELVLPREGAVLKRNAIEFQWTTVDRALFYEVRVLTADGDLMWQTRAEGPQTRPPADAAFRTGEHYVVFVSAWLPEGKAEKSSAVGFRVADR